MVCPQTRSMIIKVSVFLLTTLIILSITTVVIAQWPKPANPPPTLEEDRLINNYPNRDRIPNYYKELQSYKREGCKEALAGEWRRDGKGDIITITYDEGKKFFLGKVTRPVKLAYNPGHLLFRVSFADYNEGVQLPGNNKPVSPNEPLRLVPPAQYMDINWLRQQRQCRIAQFKGTEYSYNQTTKKKTETELWLMLSDDRLEYKVEKQSANFTKLQ